MPLRFVNPNFHVILIHYPLGVFMLGVTLEFLSFLWRRSTLRVAAKYMIVLGALLSLPAATSGIWALADVQKQGVTPARYEFLRNHVIFEGGAAIAATILAVIAIGASDRWRRRLYFPLLVGFMAVGGGFVIGSWFGGETVYQQGTSVGIIKVETAHNDDDEIIKDASGKPVQQLKLIKEATPPDLKDDKGNYKYGTVVNYYLGGATQLHLLGAGFAFAFAMGALGLSIRRLHATPAVLVTTVGTTASGQVYAQPRRVTDDVVARSIVSDPPVEPIEARVPCGRLWLLTALVVMMAFGVGYWTQTKSNALTAQGWNSYIGDLQRQYKEHKVTRDVAHAGLGAAFILLALIFSLLAWLAPRRSFLVGFFGLLLVLVISTQTWLGVLMTFNSEGESLTKFEWADEGKPTTPSPAADLKDKVDTAAEKVKAGAHEAGDAVKDKVKELERDVAPATAPTTKPAEVPPVMPTPQRAPAGSTEPAMPAKPSPEPPAPTAPAPTTPAPTAPTPTPEPAPPAPAPSIPTPEPAPTKPAPAPEATGAAPSEPSPPPPTPPTDQK